MLAKPEELLQTINAMGDEYNAISFDYLPKIDDSAACEADHRCFAGSFEQYEDDINRLSALQNDISLRAQELKGMIEADLEDDRLINSKRAEIEQGLKELNESEQEFAKVKADVERIAKQVAPDRAR